MPAFELPPGLADADTVGIIFDDVDGLNFYPEYGMLRDLFGNPALAADKRYADALRGYLGSETIAPMPLRRLAAAHPDTVDAVFRKILRRRDFTWAEHGGRGADAPTEGLVLPARAPSGCYGDRRPAARARLPRPWVKARTPAGQSRLARQCCRRD